MTVIQRMSRTPVVALLVAVFLLLTLAACSQPSLPGQLGQLQQIAKTCPSGKKLAVQVAVDDTGSSATDSIRSQRITLIKAIAQRALVCGGGHLQLMRFSDSSAGAAVVFDEELPTLPGATQTAQLRRAPAELERLDAAIDQAMSAAPGLSQRGSDVAGQLRLAGEYRSSLGDGYLLDAYMLTDGEQNVSTDLVGAASSGQDMAALAQTIDVPNLAGASLTFAGIGRTAGDPVGSATANGLVTFYKALCAKTAAATCTVVTDLSPDAIGRG